MTKKIKLAKREEELTRRYLVWCYKMTKEDLDRIDRYFTQNRVDLFLSAELKRVKEDKLSSRKNEYAKCVNDFDTYLKKKFAKALTQKFSDKNRKKLNSEYEYLQNRLSAIEKAICHFLGKKELEIINELYEEEMTLRIFEAREHS